MKTILLKQNTIRQSNEPEVFEIEDNLSNSMNSDEIQD